MHESRASRTWIPIVEMPAGHLSNGIDRHPSYRPENTEIPADIVDQFMMN
jgi:hypothetical protein